MSPTGPLGARGPAGPGPADGPGPGVGLGFEAQAAIDAVAAFPSLRVLGLMGMAPHPAGEEEKRATFKKLRGIFSVCKSLKHENIQMKHLSMGMSDDFEIAIEEGANMIRVGRALFR